MSANPETRVDEERLAETLSAALAEAAEGAERRIANDPAAYLDLVAVAAKAESQTVDLLRSAVTAARSAGQSWEAIGARLGISRQAAQQRFGRDQAGGASEPEGQVVDAAAGEVATPDSGQAQSRPGRSSGEVRVVSGLTAFNEMRALETIGRYGWHSIGYGAFHHVVRRSPNQWEHLRLFAATDAVQVLLAEGWERVGQASFPWIYLKHELDVPALAEPGGVGSVLGLR